MAGQVPETPKPGDAALARARTDVIGNRRAAIDGARAEAGRRGYLVAVREEPVTGEARTAARLRAAEIFASPLAPGVGRWCYLSAGETTVTVRGRGKGGRNQEFALAFALAQARLDAVAASIGTDGIDGPTDAAGAIVDRTTLDRADRVGLGPPAAALDDNDAYTFFSRLGDLILTGPTDTNVGDIQIVLVDP